MSVRIVSRNRIYTIVSRLFLIMNVKLTTKPPQISRIDAIDWIRGMALPGILLINIQTYSLFAFFKPQQVYAMGLDRASVYAPLQFFINTLVKGQFYTIYSFLFGLGFYLMWIRNSQAGLPAGQLFKRRLWALLVIGLIHAFVFWFGDVLHKYALLGFTLPYFNKKSVKTLLKWITGLVLAGVFLQIVLVAGFQPAPEEAAHSQQQVDNVMKEVAHTWQHGSVGAVMRLQKLGVLMLMIMGVKSGMAGWLHYEIMFLLGIIAGKMRLFNRLAEVKNKFLRWAFWMFPSGLLLKAIAGVTVFDIHLLPAGLSVYEPLVISLAYFIGTPLLTVVYLVELSLFISRYPSRVTRWIANTGRLGLTNYLLQTLLCMGLFYGYGAGLSGRLTLTATMGVAAAIYIVQVCFSNWWLRHHQQGPIEGLWRSFTYRKVGKTGPLVTEFIRQ